ncbi:3-beta hydroxysteroid dehydrogenase/isomerase [Penicillium taxi]|uniref:3-beta hydroxysteroid dehydrogenase/isomerase n=1 Tax=Penicillium taxi TaxID=168475 RepID=UPI0025454810|nr:3-beta hydroxysteroid dehydrogenase/isomerase [Penicillium taxi]KAJ5908946.1 3-beta hydroxysteroid dehydrogenase/isomerase [Penicillium taxi]
MLLILALVLGTGFLYLYHVNSAMSTTPEEALKLSPKRWTIEEIKEVYKRCQESPVDITKSLPPKQSRRYVVVGGSGLVGAWIVSHLLARGEDPQCIRILDLLSPTREILGQGVTYVKTNIANELDVTAAFERQWSPSRSQLPLSVFHTAAIIRPQDRLEIFLPLSTKVNVEGTRHILNAAKKAGATCLISTSSGSVTLQRPRFWIAPWSKIPEHVVQVMKDDAKIPQSHEQFFGNYAVTKIEAERIVRSADDPESGFRTGCIRPTNGIYGLGTEHSNTITGIYLRRGGCPTWIRNILHSFVHAENVSIAHLLYEQRLLEQSEPGSKLPNTGGQAFVVSDPNPPISFDDLYKLITTLSKTPVSFLNVPPAPFLLMAYLVELYAYVKFKYLSFLPALADDLDQIQPALFSISDVYCIADHSRATLAPEDGGWEG